MSGTPGQLLVDVLLMGAFWVHTSHEEWESDTVSLLPDQLVTCSQL